MFGDEYRDNFFAALFNLHKVTRHVLEPSGATFTSRDSDFVVSNSLDFHPTDVLEDADGSLLVIDTGAWYKLCCPDVAARQARRARRDLPRPPHGRAAPSTIRAAAQLAWNTMTPAELAALLDDDRPAVQNRAHSGSSRALGAARSPRSMTC